MQNLIPRLDSISLSSYTANVACKLMMTMMKMVKMKIKNTEDGKDEDVKIIVKMSMMMMKKFSHYDGYFVMEVIL